MNERRLSTAHLEVPVLIAGGGPVGITASMDLARMGVVSTVLESRRDIPVTS